MKHPAVHCLGKMLDVTTLLRSLFGELFQGTHSSSNHDTPEARGGEGRRENTLCLRRGAVGVAQGQERGLHQLAEKHVLANQDKLRVFFPVVIFKRAVQLLYHTKDRNHQTCRDKTQEQNTNITKQTPVIMRREETVIICGQWFGLNKPLSQMGLMGKLGGGGGFPPLLLSDCSRIAPSSGRSPQSLVIKKWSTPIRGVLTERPQVHSRRIGEIKVTFQTLASSYLWSYH